MTPWRQVAARARRPGPATVAVAAAALFTLALGLFLAVLAPPWIGIDSRAHTGYLMALTEGHIPTLDTPIEAPRGATNLDAELAAFSPVLADGTQPLADVWVANHPPGAYLPAVPGAWWASRSGDGNQVLFWQRASNVLGAALAVGFTALLARELSGRSSVAVLAAGLTALSPFLVGATYTGHTDGMGLAASVAVIWATARAVRRGFDRSGMVVVAVAASACGLVRISSLAVAVGTVALGLALTAIRARRWPWAASLKISAAVALTSGWFYLRTTLRYGDPAASSELLGRFERRPNGSWFDAVTSGGLWDGVLRRLFTTYLNGPYPQPAGRIALGLVVLAGLVVVVDLLRSRSAVPAPSDRPTTEPNRRGWILLAVAGLITLATTANHVAGGGLPHTRYLLLGIPIGACVVAHATGVVARTRAGWWAAGVPLVALLVLDLTRGPGVLRTLARPFIVDQTLGPHWLQSVLFAGAAVALVTYGVAAGVSLHPVRSHVDDEPPSPR